jgi:alpha,alpha-trehalase
VKKTTVKSKELSNKSKAESNCPRPGNWLGDYRLGMSLIDGASGGLKAARHFWSSTASACESGWDFSSRWLSPPPEEPLTLLSRRFTDTDRIVPLDLNVLMAQNYATMARLYAAMGDDGDEERCQILSSKKYIKCPIKYVLRKLTPIKIRHQK